MPRRSSTSSVCRLCSRASSNFKEIFSCLENGRIILDLVSIVCPIKISFDDGFPQEICNECLEIVVSSIKLREQSIRSEENFRKGNHQRETKEINRFDTQVYIKEEANSFENDVKDDIASFDSYFSDDSCNSSEIHEAVSRNATTTVKEDTSRFRCPLNCGATFVYKAGMIRHVKRVHEGDKEFQCPDCSLAFTTQYSLTSHRNKKHNGETQKKYDCPFKPCGIKFVYAVNVKRHVERFHEGKHLKFACSECSCRFVNQQKLQNHKIKIHLDTKESERLQFSDSNENQKYEQIKRNEKVTKFICDYCGAVFKNKITIKRHLEIHLKSQGDSIRISCNYCPKKFAHIKYLTKHQNKVHYESLPEVCEICDKRFSRKKLLKQHHIYVHDDSE